MEKKEKQKPVKRKKVKEGRPYQQIIGQMIVNYDKDGNVIHQSVINYCDYY